VVHPNWDIEVFGVTSHGSVWWTTGTYNGSTQQYSFGYLIGLNFSGLHGTAQYIGANLCQNDLFWAVGTNDSVTTVSGMSRTDFDNGLGYVSYYQPIFSGLHTMNTVGITLAPLPP